jgi:hypothetical protein
MGKELDTSSIPTLVILIEGGIVQNIVGNANANILVCDLDDDAEVPQSMVMWEVVTDDVDLFQKMLAQCQAMEAG